MAGCECEPRASASPENGARLCCHVDAAAVAVFAAACESQSARAFLTQLQSFCLLAAPDRDQRSCLRLGELYNSLALAAALDPALLSVHFWRALRRFFQLGTCEDLQHLALHVHESWARALGRGLKALEQDIRSTVDLWDLPVEHVRTEPGDPAECFLRDWEADRLRRERGIVGDLARLRVREAAQEDVEDTDGLDPDCFRFEARGYPSDEASTLHPPFPAKNCRAGRRFGHRFLTLRLGRLGAPLRDSFEFLRRRWRCVYWRLPDQVTYFATHGPGLEDMEVEDLMDSLVPLDANGEMSLLKYNQRLQLSFSETRAEVKLQATLREDLRDISGSFCLSDGCGSISLAKADEVAREMGLEERPGTFQARCGPFKGLWVVDPALDVDLVVRPSQLKYHSPVASEPLDFEVLRTSTKPMQSFLTSNSIQALEDLGVSPELFVRRQQEVLDALEAVLQEDAAEGRRALEALLAEQWLAPGTERQLLGFLDLEWPWREPNFQDCRFRACAALRRRACEELRLPLRRAHRAWIVPDHTRQLQKGECFLQLPGHSVSLAGREVLLIRSPCYHSSSVLKLRVPSTAPEGLQHLVNVVVLNAGERSGPADAELMCGDHDGDTVLLIWDEEMVAAVTTVESSIEDADLELRPQRKIGEVPREKLPGLILEELTEAARSHAAFCEADRKRRDWVDDEGFGEKATRLAGICQVGVDCAASGRTVQVPEDLRQPNCPDWAKRKGPKGAVKSDKACGRLFRAELRFVRQEQVDFLSAEALGLSQWTSAQISSAVSFALGQLQQLREQRAEIHRMAYLCKGWRDDLEKAVYRLCGRAEHDFPEGLLGVAGYLVFLAGREGASAREVRRLEALARLLEGQEVQLLETLTTCERRPADAWRLFSAETLKTRSFCLHGVCPQMPEQPFLIDPAELRFSHPAISPQFRSGLRLAEAAQRLVSGAMRKRDFAKLGRPLPVRWHKGAFHTLGNRRLAVYRLFKFFGPRDTKVLVRRVNEHEALRWPWHRKFEVDDHQGRRIRVRELEAWIGETLEETTMVI